MRKILTLILLIASTVAYSNELDEAYLQSLPDEVRLDVLSKISDREDADNTIYRRPSSMIDKPLSESETNSQRFGSQIFNMMQTSFMPINEPNFDSSYILDFGDTLEIQLIGQINSIDEISIKRDGSINVQEIGKIFIAGLTLQEAGQIIKSKITNAYIGVEVFISLINVRDIQILITGNAYNPGIYTLNGNSNLLHALSMSGGIDENGSFRQVDIIRNNQVIKSIDLYDIFIHGKSGFNQRLRSGDTILVKPFQKLVAISGAVNRPGIFELKPNETFSDLFNYANGFSISANMDAIRIERLNKDIVELIKVDNLDTLSSSIPFAGDRIDVRAYERRKVLISGAVKSPGEYVLSKGETLSTIIKKAEGYTDDAYPFGGILINKRAEVINQNAVDKLYSAYIKRLITKGDALFASDSLPFILDELKNTPVSGRVKAEFDLDVINSSPMLDTSLDDGDEIIIPLKTQQIYMYGEINNPGSVRYKPGNSIIDYINVSGGVLESADKKNIFVIHPNGEIDRYTNNSRLSFLDDAAKDILIYPGSVIYVPREVIENDPTKVASIWAPIISSLALSVTSLSVLDSN